MTILSSSGSRPGRGRRWLALGASSILSLAVLWIVLAGRIGGFETVRVIISGGPPPMFAGATPSPRTGLLRRPLTREEILETFPYLGTSHFEPHPLALFRRKAGFDLRFEWDEHPRGEFRIRTNSQGFRNDREVREFHPDLRIVVTGDSHADGLCDNHDTFTDVLERALAARRPGWTVEALNGAVGGYCFEHYVGLAEAVLPLRPDVLIVCVFGGNDLLESTWLRGMFEGGASSPSTGAFLDLARLAAKDRLGPVYQGLLAAKYFSTYPGQRDRSVEVATSVSREIVALCEENGVLPLFVYLPPMHDSQWDLEAVWLAELAGTLEIPPADRHVLDGIADRWLADLRTTSATVVDLRPTFREAAELLYWKQDGHIDIDAHQRIGGLLADTLDPLVTRRSSASGEPSGSLTASSAGSWSELFRGVSGEPLPELGLSSDQVARFVRLGGAVEHDAERLLAVPAALRPRSVAGAGDVVLLGDELGWEAETPGGIAPLVEARMRERGDGARCVDATVPGGGFHTALLAARAPELSAAKRLVLLVDSGNDFLDALRVEHASGRRSKGAAEGGTRERGSEGDDESPGSRRHSPFDPDSRWPASARVFADRPARIKEALRSAARATLQLADECGRRGAGLVLVLAPAPTDPPFPKLRSATEELASTRGVTGTEIAAVARIADTWRSYAEGNGWRVVDLGSRRWRPGMSFDETTLRLDAAGRATVAEAIASALDER